MITPTGPISKKVLEYNLEHSFHALKEILPELQKRNFPNPIHQYTKEEILRFISIGGTILDNFKNAQESIDERYITHILIRSLLEGYFWLLYIHDDPHIQKSRFEERINGFKTNYFKLYNDPHVDLHYKKKISKPDPCWGEIRRSRNIHDILVQLKTDDGAPLNYLYFTYRITSFDTHAISMPTLFQEAFKNNGNFLHTPTKKIINLMANEYYIILSQHLLANTEVE